MSPLVHTLKQAVCHLNRANQLILDALHGAILAGITQLADYDAGSRRDLSSSTSSPSKSCLDQSLTDAIHIIQVQCMYFSKR
jgi:hypothetical protein